MKLRTHALLRKEEPPEEVGLPGHLLAWLNSRRYNFSNCGRIVPDKSSNPNSSSSSSTLLIIDILCDCRHFVRTKEITFYMKTLNDIVFQSIRITVFFLLTHLLFVY